MFTRRAPASGLARPSVGALTQIHERNTIAIASTASGTLSETFAVSAGNILAARLAGYRAIYDQVRIDRFRVTFVPRLGTGQTGNIAIYIERDPTAAIVATLELASDQFEVVRGPARAPLALDWLPQQPTDHQFNLLNPGTVILSSIMLVGAGCSATAIQGDVTLELWTTMRGRP